MSEDSLPRKTIRVIQEVAVHDDGVGLSEIARETGIPKATCYRILRLLEEERWLALHPKTRRYRISLGLLGVVGSLLEGGMYPGVRAVLEGLTADSMEMSGFDSLSPPVIKVLAQVPGPHLIGLSPRPVPRNQSVWNTASGKATLATLPREQVEASFGEVFAETMAESALSFDTYLDSLAAVRERGYAIAVDELEPGAAAVAAAVPTRSGMPYAVWIGGPAYRLTKERLPELGAMTVQAAHNIGRLLGLDGSA